MSIKLFGISDWIDGLKDRNPVLGELVKQAIDQPLHILMKVASVWVIAASFYALGVADWTNISPFVYGVSLTVGWNVMREYNQWPSSRWWDPPLDWFFEALGIGLGAWTWVLFF